MATAGATSIALNASPNRFLSLALSRSTVFLDT